MAAFKFDTGKYGSINDSGVRDLPIGKHNYTILKVSYQPIKADASGKRHHIVIELRHTNGQLYTQFIEHVPKSREEAELTRARIAGEEFNAYVFAAGVKKGTVITAAKFKMLAGKEIGIETQVRTSKAKEGVKFVNTVQIIKDGFSDDELSDTPEEKASAPAKGKSKTPPPEEEEEDPPEEEEEEEEEETEDPSEEEGEEEEDDPFA